MRERSNSHLRSMLSAAIIVSVLMLSAAPALADRQPTRTVFEPEGVLIPAGEGCSFDVQGEPDDKVRAAIIEFHDGRLFIIAKGEPTLTNLETGESIAHFSAYKMTQTFDFEAGTSTVEIDGRFFATFFPGEPGPFGEVGEHGALVSLVGHTVVTINLFDGAVTSFSLDGRAVDLCAQFSK